MAHWPSKSERRRLMAFMNAGSTFFSFHSETLFDHVQVHKLEMQLLFPWVV